MELLRRLGCADAVRAVGLPEHFNTDVVYLTRINGSEITRYHRSTPADVRAGKQHDVAANWPTPEPQHFLSQIYLEPALRKCAIEQHGVDLRKGWALESFVQDADGVTTIARDMQTGETTTFRSSFLVGADGSNSRVRHGIGARLKGVPRIGDACSTFLRSRRLGELCANMPGWMLRCIDGATIIAIDGNDQWLIHTTVPAGEHRDTYDPEPAMFAAVGEPFDYEVISRARWTSRAMVASKFHEGRAFLAGDAAHLWIPMGGFGMNAGIVDAISLSWRLAGVLQGWLDARILATYEYERAPLGALVAQQAAKWGRDLAPLWIRAPKEIDALEQDPVSRAELGERIRATNLGEFECPGFQLGTTYTDSPIICHDALEPPPANSLEIYYETSWPGVRLPHLWRRDGTSLFDQLGTGFTLLRIGGVTEGDPTARGDALVAAATARQPAIPLRVLDLDEPEALQKYQNYRLVLVRSDQHVVWRSRVEPGAVEATAVLDRVTGRLLTDPVPRVHHAKRLADGFLFGEGPRLWNGTLVFSDMTGCKVLAWNPAQRRLETLCEVPEQPNGLAVLPDGRLLVSSMFDKQLFTIEPGARDLVHYCDLSALVSWYLGDVIVDSAGRLYVDDVGTRVLHGEPVRPASGRLIRVDGPGDARVEIEGLSFPNGLVISNDGQMLYLAQSGTRTVNQCRINADGSLGALRPFVSQLSDGMAGDASDGVWICVPETDGGVLRYDGAGHLTDRVVIDGGTPVSCTFDTASDTLYIVGIESLPEGTNFFTEMSTKRTKGRLWHVVLP